MQPTDRRLANAIRALAMDAVEAANSGHPGMPMGMADAATALFTRHLKFDASDPHWPDRDRFILSAGHGSMLIYALLYLTGYERPTLDDIEHFRQLGSPTAGHPENFELPGIEVTTGPLGQGLAMAVGMAIAERHLNAVYGEDLVDHRTFVIAGDGCLMEGINHEAVGLAGHLKLGRLIVLWDDNSITIDGSTELSRNEDVLARYQAGKWHTVRMRRPQRRRRRPGDRGSACRPAAEPRSAARRSSALARPTSKAPPQPTARRSDMTRSKRRVRSLVLRTRDFFVPDDVLTAWRAVGKRGGVEHALWKDRLEGAGARTSSWHASTARSAMRGSSLTSTNC